MFGRGANKLALNGGNPVGISLLLVILLSGGLIFVPAYAIEGPVIQKYGESFGIEPIWNENKTQLFIETFDFSHNETYDSSEHVINELNIAIIFSLLPVVGFAFFVNTERNVFSFHRYQKFFSLCLIILLVTWAFTLPASIGTNYWNLAYSEQHPPIEKISFDLSDPNQLIYDNGALIVQQENPYVNLDGTDDYLTIASPKTNELENLTVSAWLKLNYSKGSPEFTVVSKERSFLLSVNNLIPPEHIAKFSVFDGIRWYTIESTSSINE